MGVSAREQGQARVTVFFVPREDTVSSGVVAPPLPTESVVLNDPPPVQYDLMTDLMDYCMDDDMFKVYSDMMRSETRIQQRKSNKFGYLSMFVRQSETR